MIERIDVRELPLYEVLLRCGVDNKDFCFFYFFSIITVLYSIEVDHWLKPKGFIPMESLELRIDR